eukprot:3200651-Amphidinium_carterae.1
MDPGVNQILANLKSVNLREEIRPIPRSLVAHTQFTRGKVPWPESAPGHQILLNDSMGQGPGS